jgi:hypothetical protein
MPLRLVGINGDGSILLTRRRGEAFPWDPWINLTSAVGPIAAPSDVACAIVNGQLHICVLERGALWHTVETGPGTFTGWGPAHSVAFSGVTPGDRVDCAAIGGQLHVCLEGNSRSGTLVSQPAVWRSIRNPSGAWSTRREVTLRNPAIHEVACASITPSGAGARPQLEILTRAQTQTGSQPLVHTTLLPTGASSGDVNVSASDEGITPQSSFPTVRTIAATGIGSELHIVLGGGTELFHTVFGSAGGTFELFARVRRLVGDPAFTVGAASAFTLLPPPPLTFPACANVGGNLQLCAVSNGRIFHTIRLPSGAWRNPESNTVGLFGDVTAAVAGGPSTPAFGAIACAGDPL